MAPDNRISPLLPVWPTAPLKESGDKPRERGGGRPEKKPAGRKGSGKSGKDGKPHIDTYA
ncbi:MAG: hypothetical protein DSZ00_10235 [Gammaproteobacteria bacterium]|nr:MAG: hypothetical protein DSZ00_10235 [Gammaproteobacteria bacterium]RTZ71943.1 MAG: hypothetical protein DSZ02_10330 [Gammaproteobacteria bacterium]